MKKLIAVLLATAYLAGFSAFAADEHKCATGKQYDARSAKCVKDKTKKY